MTMGIMLESKFRGQIRKAIWESDLNFWPMVFSDTSVCPHCKKSLHPIPDRPDIILSNAGIECKSAEGTFDFSSIREGQRKWADSRTEEGYLYYLALLIEEGNERKAWLVDWTFWREVEKTLIGAASQHSLPFKARRGMRKIVQDHNLDAVTMLRDYELEWKNKGWVIPENHPARRQVSGKTNRNR